MAYTIVDAQPNDAPVIQHLACKIWPGAYAEILSARQVSYMLHLMYAIPMLQQQMASGQQQFLLLLNEQQQPVGFAGWGLEKAPHLAKLHKLYVLPCTAGTGAGSTLLQQVLHRAKQAGATHLQLQVNKHNKAQQFYLRQGFTVVESKVMDIGNGFVMDDYIMQRAL